MAALLYGSRRPFHAHPVVNAILTTAPAKMPTVVRDAALQVRLFIIQSPRAMHLGPDRRYADVLQNAAANAAAPALQDPSIATNQHACATSTHTVDVTVVVTAVVAAMSHVTSGAARLHRDRLIGTYPASSRSIHQSSSTRCRIQ